MGAGGRDPLGWPIGAGVYRQLLARLIRKTPVRRISIYGLRHTSATLLLAPAYNRTSCNSA